MRALSTLMLTGLTFLGTAPALAMADPAAEAIALIDRHRVSMQVQCTVPIPPGPYAPQWQQDNAWQAAQDFSRCLDDVMAREQARLSDLTYEVDQLQAGAADGADWAGVEAHLASKWDELDTLEGKVRNRARWAETAINVVNALTPPPPADPMFPPFSAGSTPYPYYRRDSSVSAPGIR